MGLRANWETEESRRQRFNPQGYAGVMPQWMAQAGQQAMQIGQAGAEEARAEGRRAADVLSESRREQGSTFGQGLQQAVSGGLGAYRGARQDARAEEQMALQREQANQQRERSRLEMQYLPGQLEQQQQQGQAQLEQTRATTAEQQMRIDAARATNDFMNTDAQQAGFAGANPGETVRTYQLRMQSLQNEEELKNIQAQRELAAFNLETLRDLAPEQKRSLIAQNKQLEQSLQIRAIEGSMARMDAEEKKRGINVRNLTNILLSSGPSAEAFNTKASQMREDGVPADLVGEALVAARNSLANTEQQQILMDQMSPEYKHYMRKVDKANLYSDALAILDNQSKYIGGGFTLSSAQEQQSITSMTAALRQLGMDDLAESLMSGWTLQGATPTSRKQLVDQTIQRLRDQMAAELSSGALPVSESGRRAYNMMLQVSQDIFKGNGGQSMAPGQGGLDFTGLRNFDPSGQGGAL